MSSEEGLCEEAVSLYCCLERNTITGVLMRSQEMLILLSGNQWPHDNA